MARDILSSRAPKPEITDLAPLLPRRHEDDVGSEPWQIGYTTQVFEVRKSIEHAIGRRWHLENDCGCAARRVDRVHHARPIEDEIAVIVQIVHKSGLLKL